MPNKKNESNPPWDERREVLSDMLGDDFYRAERNGGGYLERVQKILADKPCAKKLIRELAMDPTFNWLFPAWESLVFATDPGLFKYAPATIILDEQPGESQNNYFVELIFLYYVGPTNRRRLWAKAMQSSTALHSAIQYLNSNPDNIEKIFDKSQLSYIGYKKYGKAMRSILTKLGASQQVLEIIEKIVIDEDGPTLGISG